MVDIISKTCIHTGCKTHPVFNYEGKTKRLYCNLHKLEGMVNTISKTCIHTDCKTRPVFNYEGKTKGLYCNMHKLEGMVNIKNKTCKSDWCYIQVTEKYEGYCLRCYIYLFPDKPINRNYKTKETAVSEFIKSSFPTMDWITDKRVYEGCSKRRPDLLLDLGQKVIIVEVDENQHIQYDTTCENKRLMEISTDLGYRSLIMVRFNPDDYEEGSVSISSCWGINKKGLCVVKKTKKQEWENRLNKLYNILHYWIKTESSKMIELERLFFDY
jgi:hypothetical protein